MKILVSNSIYSAGHLYVYDNLFTKSLVKYLVSGELFPTPESAKEFAPLFFKWVTESRNSHDYIKRKPHNVDLFTSAAIRNTFANFDVRFNMELAFEYLTKLSNPTRAQVFQDLNSFVKNSDFQYRHKEILYDLLGFTWQLIFKTYRNQDVEPPNKGPQQMFPDEPDEKDWRDCTLHPKINATNPKTAAKGKTAMTDQTKLFKFINANGKEIFCTYLATDSTGKWVVETKGTGVVFSADKDKLEEVVPFTVTLCDPNGGRDIHYNLEGDTSILKQGMWLITDNSSLWTVKKMNSKVKTSNVFDPTKWSVIPTVPLVQAAATDDKAAK